MSAFPGRFLEELDGIDLNRYMRARAAGRYETVEARRKLFLAGKLKSEDIDADDWKLIAEMDEIENGHGL